MSDPVRTRFAPSPTGFLHVGGARTALFNWLYAKRHQGSFVLRIEDTDKNRNIGDGLEAVLSGLRWLGLSWDEGPEIEGEFGPYFQSERQDIYQKHLETLRSKDLVYEEENGAVRFRSPGMPVVVDDQICGRVEFQRDEPDMTIQRPDGSFIFHFVNVVDDLEMGITHVLRGEDHLSNTPKHVELFQALAAAPPVYAHIPLLLNDNGSKMSKRDAGSSVKEYEDRQFLPEAVVNYLSLLGWSPKDDREEFSSSELIERFDLSQVNRSNATFDPKKCLWLNAQHLMKLPEDAFVAQAKKALSGSPIDPNHPDLEKILPLMQKKVQLFSELPKRIAFFFEEGCTYDPKALEKLRSDASMDKKLCALREGLAQLENWDEDDLGQGLASVAKSLEVKKGALMFPMRVVASGQTGGPDLLPMLAILGKEKVLSRIEATQQALGA